MKLQNIEEAKDVLESYAEAKNAYDALERFESQCKLTGDLKNVDTYGVKIVLYPISSCEPPVVLHVQNRALECEAVQVIRDAYEYHKKQVEAL